MKKISGNTITQIVKELFLDMNYNVDQRVRDKMAEALTIEKDERAQSILHQLLENQEIATREQVAICQDTGMAIVYVTMGQDVFIEGGYIGDAIEDGVREAYHEGYLRKSIVAEPLFHRMNTGDNTPAIIEYHIVPGDVFKITAVAKGFGSENMSAIAFLKPSDGEEGVVDFVVNTVKKAGPNPCPPIVVGVGIGGTMEKAASLAKKATLRPLGDHHDHPLYSALEQKLLQKINDLHIGPGGFGGITTALAVHVDYYPTHIAGMPVAVNICCHALRHGEREL